MKMPRVLALLPLFAVHGTVMATYDDYAHEWHTPPSKCHDELQMGTGLALSPFNQTVVTE
jgi:hypothetical protein